MTCEDAEEPPMLAMRGAERCTNMKAEIKGVGSRWIVVRSDNALNLGPVPLPAVGLSSPIFDFCTVEGLRKWVGVDGSTSAAKMPLLLG